MGRLWLAITTFFQILFDSATAAQVQKLLTAPTPEATPATPSQPVAPVQPPKPASAPVAKRSDALTLLEVLQREARLIDFIQEEIDTYSDQQVGSAVREVHRACRATLGRLFQLVPVLTEQEGSQFTVQKTDPAARIRLIGKVVETRPVTGTLVHPGWRAERSEVPQWSGSPGTELIVAPAEIELS